MARIIHTLTARPDGPFSAYPNGCNAVTSTHSDRPHRVWELVDFGSTFTKVTVVDEFGVHLGSAQSGTTISTDVLEGYDRALSALPPSILCAERRNISCSSAGGGLKIVVVGLEEDVTTKAAVQVALNSGGRVSRIVSGRLDASGTERVVSDAADIVLLVGGTDGGNESCLLHNAAALADAKPAGVVVLAGNSEVKKRAFDILDKGGLEARTADNVLPRVGVVSPDSAQTVIRDAFIQHVIGGKHLSRDGRFLEMVALPTPDAVRNALDLLSHGYEELSGVGPLMAVDVGGATTDVYSSVGPGSVGSTRRALVPEPLTARTVEADLGVRWSADGVVAAAKKLGLISGEHADRLAGCAQTRSENPSFMPETPAEVDDDLELAHLAAAIAIRRHAGVRRITAEKDGVSIYTDGRDLRDMPFILMTGGVFRAYGERDFSASMSAALDGLESRLLTPRVVQVQVDRNYLLAAAGLLAQADPRAALNLMTTQLVDQEQRRAS